MCVTNLSCTWLKVKYTWGRPDIVAYQRFFDTITSWTRFPNMPIGYRIVYCNVEVWIICHWPTPSRVLNSPLDTSYKVALMQFTFWFHLKPTFKRLLTIHLHICTVNLALACFCSIHLLTHHNKFHKLCISQWNFHLFYPICWPKHGNLYFSWSCHWFQQLGHWLN